MIESKKIYEEELFFKLFRLEKTLEDFIESSNDNGKSIGVDYALGYLDYIDALKKFRDNNTESIGNSKIKIEGKDKLMQDALESLKRFKTNLQNSQQTNSLDYQELSGLNEILVAYGFEKIIGDLLLMYSSSDYKT